MSPFVLVASLGIAAGIFAGFLWSLYRVMLSDGTPRRVHAATALLTLLGMGAVQAVAPFAGQVAGGLLVAAAFGAVLAERGWSRLLPGFPLLFGVALLARIPFAG